MGPTCISFELVMKQQHSQQLLRMWNKNFFVREMGLENCFSFKPVE
jgi:hypothetical protein